MNRSRDRNVTIVVAAVVMLLSFMAVPIATAAAQPPIRLMLVGPMQLPDEAFLQFAKRVKPDIVVLGAFAAPQWAEQDDPRAWLQKWNTVIARLHRRTGKARYGCRIYPPTEQRADL